MGEHVLAIDVASIDWIYICHTIRMEGGLTEICGESRVRQPSRRSLKVLSGGIRLCLLLGRLRPLLYILLVNSNLSMMILLLSGSSLRHLLLLLSGHQCLRANDDLVIVQVVPNGIVILSVVESVAACLLG